MYWALVTTFGNCRQRQKRFSSQFFCSLFTFPDNAQVINLDYLKVYPDYSYLNNSFANKYTEAAHNRVLAVCSAAHQRTIREPAFNSGYQVYYSFITFCKLKFCAQHFFIPSFFKPKKVKIFFFFAVICVYSFFFYFKYCWIVCREIDKIVMNLFFLQCSSRPHLFFVTSQNRIHFTPKKKCIGSLCSNIPLKNYWAFMWKNKQL